MTVRIHISHLHLLRVGNAALLTATAHALQLAAVPKTLPVNSSNILKVLVLGQKKGLLFQPHCLSKINPRFSHPVLPGKDIGK